MSEGSSAVVAFPSFFSFLSNYKCRKNQREGILLVSVVCKSNHVWCFFSVTVGHLCGFLLGFLKNAHRVGMATVITVSSKIFHALSFQWDMVAEVKGYPRNDRVLKPPNMCLPS